MASVHASERDALLERALALGLMAEQHDELGTFLDYAESELNSRVGKLREMYRLDPFHAAGDSCWQSERKLSCLSYYGTFRLRPMEILFCRLEMSKVQLKVIKQAISSQRRWQGEDWN